MDTVKIDPDVASKGGAPIMVASYSTAFKLMSKGSFLQDLRSYDTEAIDEEMCDLLAPYLEMDDFTTEMAAKASGNVAGLCSWCRAMVEFYYISKFVKPKMVALKEMEAKLWIATENLREAEETLAQKQAEVDELNTQFEAAMAEKQQTQESAEATKAKMDAAQQLITGLGGEKKRWTLQASEFESVKERLAGDVAVVSSFLTFCGPFNTQYRAQLRKDIFEEQCRIQGLKFSPDLEIVEFVTNSRIRGQWAMQGLPNDELSLQNGAITMLADNWPLMIDPQSQGSRWLSNKEAERLTTVMGSSVSLRRCLEDAMRDGRSLLIQDVVQPLDPVLEPVLNKLIIRKGMQLSIDLPDKEGCEYSDEFRIFFNTKLPNPHYSPELFAQTTVIDFTVTLQGLEDQLLSRVVNSERADLEEARQNLVTEINNCGAKVVELEDTLLFKLSSVQGSLLDDKEIIDVLNDTKRVSNEVKEKLVIAGATNENITVAREEYRPVATRGAVIYFLLVEMAAVNPMYQSSLQQFVGIFMEAILKAQDGEGETSKRCKAIIDELTFLSFQYTTRALFEKHKMLFTLLLALKVELRAGGITDVGLSLLLKAGGALDLKSQPMKSLDWISDSVWLNLCEMANSGSGKLRFVRKSIEQDPEMWQKWAESECPESSPVPDDQFKHLSHFEQLVLIRCVRADRMLLSAKSFIEDTLGKQFLFFAPLDMEAAWTETAPLTPLVFLLSPGTNPNAVIEAMAKRKKIPIEGISMGQGQEKRAEQLVEAAFENGSWVLLQNTHLGLGFMNRLELILAKEPQAHPDSRVWISCESHPKFPIGLLHCSIKVTDEPPAGLKPGLRKLYSWLNQDWIEAVSGTQWRATLFGLCFLHAVVQERRKFGPLGWNIPYEFNHSDFEASAIYLRSHMGEAELRRSAVSWPAIQYMVCEVQYGGRITDDFDRRTIVTYGSAWLSSKSNSEGAELGDGFPVFKFDQIGAYREKIEELQDNDHPDVFGLHANADLTFRGQECHQLLDTIMSMLPKDSAGSGGSSGGREQLVARKAKDLLAQLPDSFDDHTVRTQLQSQGAAQPLTIHLRQEIQRMGVVLSLAKKMLQSLGLALEGAIIMTSDLVDTLNSIFDARVPSLWLAKSWQSPTLGLWMTSLLDRTAQLLDWLTAGRPKAYWLAGFFNPQGFLTAVQQEVSRENAGWSLDRTAIRTEVMPGLYKKEADRKPRVSVGVLVWGLYLEAAAWGGTALVDQPPNELFSEIPCVLVTAQLIKPQSGEQQYYPCPVYATRQRTGLNFIFVANFPIVDPVRKWILRGVACLCNID